MHLPSFFGFGAKRIIDLDRQTAGKVTDVKTCWWLRINTEPIRTARNSRYPHIVRFTYMVNGMQYSGTRFLNWQDHPPVIGHEFRLFYDPENPKKFAIPSL